MGEEIRNMLDKVRKLQDSNRTISLTEVSGKDIKKLLSEETITRIPNTIMGDEGVQYPTPDEQREEENKFKEIVSKLAKFEKIKVYPDNVEWSGSLIRENIEWYFTLEETSGCFINTKDAIKLTDDVLEVIQKIRGYYETWSSEWASRLTGQSEQ